MSVSEENGLPASSESFWEVGQYKKTAKRVEDGQKLCGDMMALVKERGDIEAAYAKQLHAWAKKWNEQVEKGAEYGTMEAAWKGVLEEAVKKCDVHMRVRDRLNEEVLNTIKTWQKDNFHSRTLGGVKESKDAEEAFKKVQKPWAKLYSKVEKAKKDYYSACKAERTAIQNDKNASADTSVSPDQTKKMAEKVEKCREEKDKFRETYEEALKHINVYNAKYMEDMTQVFEKCQESELKRLKFFKEMLFGIHKCLDLTQEPKMAQIYKDYWQTVEMSDSQQDLRWWAQSHGTGMPMNWPVFEEYSPELRRITKKEKRGEPGGVTLLAQKSTENVPPQQNGRVLTHPNGNVQATVNGNSRHSSAEPGSPSPYEDDWDASNLTDSGEPGIPVQALYDYDAQESDELSLKKGDVFEKLEDEDDQGWCKGRKDGTVGLYPANYAGAPS